MDRGLSLFLPHTWTFTSINSTLPTLVWFYLLPSVVATQAICCFSVWWLVMVIIHSAGLVYAYQTNDSRCHKPFRKFGYISNLIVLLGVCAIFAAAAAVSLLSGFARYISMERKRMFECRVGRCSPESSLTLIAHLLLSVWILRPLLGSQERIHSETIRRTPATKTRRRTCT